MAVSSPLRVAIFGESYLPYLSGVTVATDVLARGLVQAGHQVLLVMPRPAKEPPAPEPGEPALAWLPSYQAPRPAPPGYRIPIPIPSTALEAARAFGPHLVHAQSPFISGLMARRVARSVGLGCAAIIAPGTDLAAEISADIGARRGGPLVRAIPTGLDLEWIAAVSEGHPRREAGWTPGVDFVVASLGRLAREKSVELLLEAFARAGTDRPELRFVLIGGGPLENAIRRRGQRADLRGRLFVTGQRSREEALGLLKACELFAFASRTETQGLVLAEALACGVPVVALEGPGVRDTVRDGTDGVILPRDPESAAAERLGAALVALASDPEQRDAMAGNARDGASRFALQRRIGEVVELYRQTLASR